MVALPPLPDAVATSTRDAGEPGSLSAAATPRLPGDVARLKDTAEYLRNENERWRELHSAGAAFREIALTDYAREQSLFANHREVAMRDADMRCFSGRKAYELADKDNAEAIRQAESAAQRAEERFAAATRAFEGWKRSNERAIADATERQNEQLAKAQQRLAKVRADSEVRVEKAAQDLTRESHRADAEVSQEHEKLERQHLALEARGQERHQRANDRVARAEAATAATEKWSEQRIVAAEYRKDRSSEAAACKVRLKRQEKEDVDLKMSMRIQQALEERELRTNAARQQADDAEWDLQHRGRRADEAIRAIQKEVDAVFAHCDEMDSGQRGFLQWMRRDLEGKMASWHARAREVEDGCRCQLEEVGQATESVKRELEAEAQALLTHASEEAAAHRARAHEHLKVLHGLALHNNALKTQASALTAKRLLVADSLARQQCAEVETVCSSKTSQARGETARMQDVCTERVRNDAGHLANYCELPEAVLPPSAGSSNLTGGLAITSALVSASNPSRSLDVATSTAAAQAYGTGGVGSRLVGQPGGASLLDAGSSRRLQVEEVS